MEKFKAVVAKIIKGLRSFLGLMDYSETITNINGQLKSFSDSLKEASERDSILIEKLSSIEK